MTIEQLFGHDQSHVSEDHFEKVFGTLNEGPIEGAANECEVVASAPPAMTVEVRTGTFVTGGCFARVSAQDLLAIGAADALNPRIDRIVCRRDNATNLVTVYVLAGVAAGAPVPPALTRAAGVWEISLAQVYVAAAVVLINTADITDERHNYDVCGFTTGRGTRGVEILDRDLSQVDVANDAVERSIYSFEIPAGALGATGGIRLTLTGDLLKNVGSAITIRVKLGATTAMASAALTLTSVANRYKWVWEIEFLNSAAAAQKWSTMLHGVAGAQDIGFLLGDDNGAFVAAGIGTSAEDTSGALTLDVTVDWGVANANLSFRKEKAVLELLPPA